MFVQWKSKSEILLELRDRTLHKRVYQWIERST